MPASAQKSADTLRTMWTDPVVNIDPYYNSQRTGLILAHRVWDGLVFRDPNGFVMKRLLVEPWKWIDDTTLEFSLRRGVKFHDGDPFSAADVAYTVKLITDPASGISMPSNVDDQSHDPEVTGILKQAGSIADPEARKKLYAEAIHMITDRAYWLPLSTYVTVYGLSRQLDFTAYPDEMPRFFWAKWK